MLDYSTKRLFLLVKWLLFPGLDISTRKRRKFTRYFLPGNIQTLDVGCGNGAFSFAAAKLGNRVVGIDFDSEKLRRCEEFRDYLKIPRERCDFRVRNIYELEKLDQTFDQIICFETLEHLLGDEKAINIFSRILKPGGLLHLCTPHKKRRPMYGEILSQKEDGGHMRWGYELDDFKTLLQKQNFNILHSDKAVGFFGLKVLNMAQQISLSPLTKALPKISKGILSSFIILPLYPITFLDNVIPSQNLNIYVCAKKQA